MSTPVPRLFASLIDDAAVFPPGNAPLPTAVAGHRQHRASWYTDLVGPLLVPASALGEVPPLLDDEEQIAVGVIGNVPLDELGAACDGVDERIRVRQVEAPVAQRGEDPLPGLDRLLQIARSRPHLDAYAELPMTAGFLGGLDRLAQARTDGVRIAAKFRTGGLVADLFPTPVELAAVICACRDRQLPFKLTAGLHNAVRHTDPETGFRHHGYLNVLVAAGAAARGADVAEVAEWLEVTDPAALREAAGARRHEARPIWIGFGSCSIREPLDDLVQLGLMDGGFEQ
ncbi:MAG TPA: hypothetical protein VFX61_22155 [Micromonosporaceae bacterium]|nr:hypothetical protein [Micromonosporaceae bacterium]